MLLTSFQVMLLEVDLAGYLGALDHYLSTEAKVSLATWSKAAKAKAHKEIEAVGAFLTKHEMVKIIVSINTHCLEENGYLIYLDADANNLGVCNTEIVCVVLATAPACMYKCQCHVTGSMRLYSLHSLSIHFKKS